MVKAKESHDGPLQCPTCKKYRKLIFKKKGFMKHGKGIGYNLPFLKCEDCNIETNVIPTQIIEDLSRKQLVEIKKGCYVQPIWGENETFEKYKDCSFKYDARDYYYIPGLMRPWKDGALTPVFFDKSLLLHYNNHPDYKVIMRSFSRVSIQKKGEGLLSHGMGINRNGLIFAWLCDLYDEIFNLEDKQEYYRFLASNVESDHDIVSDYYFSEIEVNFYEEDNEIKLFKIKDEFESIIKDKYDFDLTKFKEDFLSGDYKFPIINEKNQVFNSYNFLQILIIETINRDKLKDKLIENGLKYKDLKGLGSLKLLSLFLEKVLKYDNTYDLMSPLFVLYDLRILGSHLSSENFDSEYKDCQSRLSISNELNYIDTFEELIKKLIEFYKKLKKILETPPRPSDI